MELVTMGEAAHRIGVSVDTVRRRLRRGELQGRHQPTPQGFIWLIEIPEQSGLGMASEAGMGGRGSAPADAAAGPAITSASTPADVAPSAGDVRTLRELMVVLRQEIDARDRQLETKDRQIEQLHVLLQQTQYVSSPLGQDRTWNSGLSALDAGLNA
jgi:hypothetical protein